jgi:hypothetical protein
MIGSGQTRFRCPAGRSQSRLSSPSGCGSQLDCASSGTADEAWLKRGLPCS